MDRQDRQKEIEQLKASINATIKQLAEDQDRLFILANRPDLIEVAPEPKEPETWEELVNFEGISYGESRDENYADTDLHDYVFELYRSTDERSAEISNFIKRLLIADYCGRRGFEVGKENYCVEHSIDGYRATSYVTANFKECNYFSTTESAEKYLKICLNSNLL